MEEIIINTSKKIELIDITSKITNISFSDGLLLARCPHTSCALFINEYDEDLKEDFEKLALDLNNRLNPEFKHILIWDKKGAVSHSCGHLISAMLGSQVIMDVVSSKISLGQYQKLLLMEFAGPRERKVILNNFALLP